MSFPPNGACMHLCIHKCTSPAINQLNSASVRFTWSIYPRGVRSAFVQTKSAASLSQISNCKMEETPRLYLWADIFPTSTSCRVCAGARNKPGDQLSQRSTVCDTESINMRDNRQIVTGRRVRRFKRRTRQLSRESAATVEKVRPTLNLLSCVTFGRLRNRWWTRPLAPVTSYAAFQSPRFLFLLLLLL